jgi:hypothetical protein
MVLIDDPETAASVRSDAETDRIENVIKTDLPGMAQPGRTLAMFWRGTVLRRGCLVDRYTDRDLHPEWMGRRNKAVLSWPTNMGLWEEYWELRTKAYQGDPDAQEPRWRDADGTARRAYYFYLENRALMDEAFAVSWPDDYVRDETPDGTPLEASAQQHYMNVLQKIGEESFATEYQNEPIEETDELESLGMAQVASRHNEYDHMIVPEHAERLVRFIDVGARECYYVVMAVEHDCTGYVIDYGKVKVHAPPGDLSDPNSEARKAGEVRLLEALRGMRDRERAEGYLTPDGEIRHVDLTGVDAGFWGGVVATYCQESGALFRPCIGRGTMQGQKRYWAPKNGKDQRVSRPNWYASRQSDKRWLFVLNADHWKHFTHERYLQDVGTPGATTLFQGEVNRHRWYAKHIVSERWDPEVGRWRKQGENHLLDCTAGCHAMADMAGCRLQSDTRPKHNAQTRKTRPIGGPGLIRTKY